MEGVVNTTVYNFLARRLVLGSRDCRTKLERHARSSAQHDNKTGDTMPLAFLCKEGCECSNNKLVLGSSGPPWDHAVYVTLPLTLAFVCA